MLLSLVGAHVQMVWPVVNVVALINTVSGRTTYVQKIPFMVYTS